MTYAHVQTAESKEDAEKFIEKNKDKEAALMFTTPKSTGISSLFGLFSSDEYDSTLDKDIADNVDLLKIDATDEQFDELKEKYKVDETPEMILLDKGNVVLQEKPDEDTEEHV